MKRLFRKRAISGVAEMVFEPEPRTFEDLCEEIWNWSTRRENLRGRVEAFDKARDKSHRIDINDWQLAVDEDIQREAARKLSAELDSLEQKMAVGGNPINLEGFRAMLTGQYGVAPALGGLAASETEITNSIENLRTRADHWKKESDALDHRQMKIIVDSTFEISKDEAKTLFEDLDRDRQLHIASARAIYAELDRLEQKCAEQGQPFRLTDLREKITGPDGVKFPVTLGSSSGQGASKKVKLDLLAEEP